VVTPTVEAPIGGKIIAGDDEKDPDALAGHLWDLHSKRDRLRH
jgi:hypothetical protein